MQSCPRVASCPLFAQFKVKSSLKVWQAFFCEGQYDRCARYKLTVQAKPVPLNLLPNGRVLDVPLEQLDEKHFH